MELIENQALRVSIEKKDFVTYLLGLLPSEIAQVVTRVQKEFENDYDYIKDLRELIVADQLNEESPEIRTHYLDQWSKTKNTEKIIVKFEEYESPRLNVMKVEVNSEVKQNKFRKYVPNEASQKSKQQTFRAYPNNENAKNIYFNNKKKCYLCAEYGHKSYECKFKKKWKS